MANLGYFLILAYKQFNDGWGHGDAAVERNSNDVRCEVQQLIQIGKPAPVQSVRDMFQQMAQREADEIRRLKRILAERLQH